MGKQLLVKESLPISAPASTVWEVLTKPKYIRQWDELPEDFGDQSLKLGSEIAWAGHSKLTVITFEPRNLLRMSLYVSSWELPPASYDIAYTYTLLEHEGHTLLTIEIGDFAPLPNRKEYYEASLEFANTASQKIKELAENSV